MRSPSIRQLWFIAAWAGCVLLVSMAARMVAGRQLELARAELAAAKSRAADLAAQATLAPSPAKQHIDYVMRLPNSLSAEKFIGRVQSACAAQGVTFTSLAAQERAAVSSALPRIELQLAFRGSYAAIKDVLAAVADGQVGTVIHRLAIRRAAPGATELGTQVEAQVDVWLLAQPRGVTGG